MSNRPLLRRLRLFFDRDLWRIDPVSLFPWQRRGVSLLQQTVLVLRNFNADQCLMQAAALTYTSILSLIPFLALVFAILKGLGVQNMLEPMLLERFTVGGDKVVSAIIHYIDNTHVGTLGAFGILLLVVSVYLLLSKIEYSFNNICGIRKHRSPYRRFADYFSVGLIAPILLMAAVSVTTSLRSQTLVQHLLDSRLVGPLVLVAIKALPFVVMWTVFLGLYIFMPNSRIRWRAALTGAVIGGTSWQLAQYAYIGLQMGVSRYNAIYGTLAALPIFMVWVQVSWVIVLLGLEVVNVAQNFHTLRQEVQTEELSFGTRLNLALAVLLRVGREFLQGRPPLSSEQLAVALGLTQRQTQELLRSLVRTRLLSEVATEDDEAPGYQPARSPETLLVAEVLRRLREDGTNSSGGSPLPERETVHRLREEVERAEVEALAGRTLAEVILQAEGATEATG